MAAITTEQPTTQAPPQLPLDVRAYLGQYHPNEEYEVQWYVEHVRASETLSRAFLMGSIYPAHVHIDNPIGDERTRSRVEKRANNRPSRYRFHNWTTFNAGELDDVADHPAGICSGCTQTWRIEHGLGADVSDLRDLPGVAK